MRKTHTRRQALLTLIAERKKATGRELATSLGIGLRTLYRDVEYLLDEGAPILGISSLGYVWGGDKKVSANSQGGH